MEGETQNYPKQENENTNNAINVNEQTEANGIANNHANPQENANMNGNPNYNPQMNPNMNGNPNYNPQMNPNMNGNPNYNPQMNPNMNGNYNYNGQSYGYNSANNFYNNVRDDSANFQPNEINDGKAMGVLSYIIPLIPFFVEKENRFVMYHAKQGMNLCIWAIIITVATTLLAFVPVIRIFTSIIGSLLGLLIFVLCIIGIINVCEGKAKELPIINKMKFIK